MELKHTKTTRATIDYFESGVIRYRIVNEMGAYYYQFLSPDGWRDLVDDKTVEALADAWVASRFRRPAAQIR